MGKRESLSLKGDPVVYAVSSQSWCADVGSLWVRMLTVALRCTRTMQFSKSSMTCDNSFVAQPKPRTNSESTPGLPACNPSSAPEEPAGRAGVAMPVIGDVAPVGVGPPALSVVVLVGN